ncbi:MAG: hypothetical protein ABIA76_00585 [Candidatus Diapherotrites archaeon]
MFLLEHLFWVLAFFGFEAVFLFVSASLAGLVSEKNTLSNGFKISSINFFIALISGFLFNNLIISALVYIFSRIYFIKEIYGISYDEAFTIWIYSAVIMAIGVFLAIV